MLRKLLSIVFAINIVVSSIGIQVMQHHCIWCGGDRIELVRPGHHNACASTCCSGEESPRHDCREEGCCQPRLLKLTNGIASGEDLDLSRLESRPLTVDSIFLLTYLTLRWNYDTDDNFSDKCLYPGSSPPALLSVPLRC